MSDDVARLVPAGPLKDFCARVFQEFGVTQENAHIAADVLVAADLRGVSSHGVAHLRRYVDGLRDGVIVARPNELVLMENPATATIDAGAGLGQPVSYRAMQMAIQKALQVGAGFVTVRNSNHYGIAGYYAMMALRDDCIGISMTNASAKALPTFGREALLGTNPIAVAAPAANEHPFVLDMATSTVSLGKIEVSAQLDESIPLGWAIDKYGNPAQDSHETLNGLGRDEGGGLLPLGGEGELLSGYKGYGLALWVEIFSALLSGSAYSKFTYPKTKDGKRLPANVGHFFGAWHVNSFLPANEFKTAMDNLQRLIRNTPKATGHDRIYIHGEKEAEAVHRHLREGVPLNAKVLADLRAIALELHLDYDL